MSPQKTTDYLCRLLQELISSGLENEWIEFKENNVFHERIGEYISALGNSAAINYQEFGYLIWGVTDKLEICGTKFKPEVEKIGNEPLETWLKRLISPRISFKFYHCEYKNLPIVILEIPRARNEPIKFKNIEHIRSGSTLQKLQTHTELERKLWRIFSEQPFEDQIALTDVNSSKIISLLDIEAFFKLKDLSPEANESYILEALSSENLIRKNPAGLWDITNLGAILFAKDLSDFSNLRWKSFRIIEYNGINKLDGAKVDEYISQGYASAFEMIISSVNRLFPLNEVMGQALRKNIPMYPPISVRELIANALIHQDFFITGIHPTIEIFSNRIEITNPGTPLISLERFLDHPPRSRNEALASFMRRIGICESRGSGIDKVVFQTEYHQLPAPFFSQTPSSTQAILFAHKSFKKMDKEEKIRATYLHASLKCVQREYLTNKSLRERFGLDESNSSMAITSKLIKDTICAGRIIAYDPNAGTKAQKYIPFWASPSQETL